MVQGRKACIPSCADMLVGEEGSKYGWGRGVVGILRRILMGGGRWYTRRGGRGGRESLLVVTLEIIELPALVSLMLLPVVVAVMVVVVVVGVWPPRLPPSLSLATVLKVLVGLPGSLAKLNGVLMV